MDFVISDHHFHHKNIIEYCNRPYDSAEEMDAALAEKWNDVVDPDDKVLHLGDLTISSRTARLLDLFETLNGSIVYVMGNHDHTKLDTLDEVDFFEHVRFEYGGHNFHAVHDPADAPKNHDGWVLHGHHHNNWPDKYPLVNPTDRRVNCSVELLEYRPIKMDRLSDLLERRAWVDQLGGRKHE